MNAALPLPEHFGQTRTLFVTAGTPAAILVTPAGATHRQRTMRFKDAPAALAWCITKGANMVYTAPPRTPARN